MSRTTQWTMVAFAAAFLHATPVWAVMGTPGGICAAAKQKAAGKKADEKLKCHAKKVVNDLPADPACLAKAEAKFSKAFAKAEVKGGCVQTGDAAAVESIVDSFVQTIVVITPGTTTTSTTLPCGGAIIGGVCWFAGSPGDSCVTTCASQSRPYNVATKDYAGSGPMATDANCTTVAQALTPGVPSATASNQGSGIGCASFGGTLLIRDTSPTTDTGSSGSFVRYCACE